MSTTTQVHEGAIHTNVLVRVPGSTQVGALQIQIIERRPAALTAVALGAVQITVIEKRSDSAAQFGQIGVNVLYKLRPFDTMLYVLC